MANYPYDPTLRFDLSRRAFVKYSVVVVGVPAFAVAANFADDVAGGGAEGLWPKFLVRREIDEVYLKMRAIGFHAKAGSRKLKPVRGAPDYLLEFTLPPQHFAERTIIAEMIPEVFKAVDLDQISLTPSAPSTLVFRVPAESIDLEIEELLDWARFELITPDARKWGADYDLEIPRAPDQWISRVEIPFGIELSPLNGGPRLTFSGSTRPNSSPRWTELWSTALQTVARESRRFPLRMEIFSVRGFQRAGQTGSIADGTYLVSYRSKLSSPQPPESPPIENKERAELAASLSPRFPDTGRVHPKRASARLLLVDEKPPVDYVAAYAQGRSISVSQLRLSARGGSLDLLAKFEPYPGSAFSGWTHSAILGRDTFVQIVREGFLFPFGTPCQLISIAQRVFGKDEYGHFVAPLIKQTFLKVKPNKLALDHGESPFRYLSVTTEQTPPLDRPDSGTSDYATQDYFLPMIGGQPFAFDHVGTDWAGELHRSSMPMFFVSNRARARNGLIYEPGYTWAPDQQTSPPHPIHGIPKSGEGLRVVDRKWAAHSYRFAKYGGAVVNLAKSSQRGGAAQKLDWVEWVRGNIPDLDPKVAVRTPFGPRGRTMRIQPQASAHLSGEKNAMLVTYRDTRFATRPFLDPEPTTDPPSDYFSNVTAGIDERDAPYIYFLETRPLLDQPARPAPRSQSDVAKAIRVLYFKTSDADAISTALFEGIDNEIGFGRQESADGIGGLSVPDTHASIANRTFGVVGDATFNERRWPGLADAKAKLEAANRLDFAALSFAKPPLDQQPFEATRTEAMRQAKIAAARALMGFPATAAFADAAADAGSFAPNLTLGDLFGADAELIPGLRFADIFAKILLAGSENRASPLVFSKSAEPLAWDVKFTGIEWLAQVQRAGSAAPPLTTLLSELIRDAVPDTTSKPLSLGLEARLNWSNTSFEPVTVGPARFIPADGKTKITIDAAARVDLGTPIIEANPPRLSFAPGKARIAASSEVVEFAVEIFKAIRINFRSVAFRIAEDGSKSFVAKLGEVKLLGPLDFINQLQGMLGGLGEDYGIKTDITPARARISQTLQFPKEDEPLLIGPAQVTNLSFGWAVTIPLMGRDVLCVAFAISSREKPLTIYVPPWYGGKAYVLLEATTRGCRLVEISMEYGALIPVNWGPARGQASLMAGIFYRLEKLDAEDSARIQLKGFVKALANVSVAGIIHFTGLIYIVLSYTSGGSGPREVQGTALIRVSIKIGFVRYSYSFTAKHNKGQAGQGERRPLSNRMLDSPASDPCKDSSPQVAVFPYGERFSTEARAARSRLLAGYRSAERTL